MTRVPDSELVKVPGNTLITATPEEGRAPAFTLARHAIHTIQPDLDVLEGGRPVHATSPDSFIAASRVVAIEFPAGRSPAVDTIAAQRTIPSQKDDHPLQFPAPVRDHGAVGRGRDHTLLLAGMVGALVYASGR